MLKTLSIIALAIYFIVIMLVVNKGKKTSNTLDFFFAKRSLPFWALSLTFVASWWGASSAMQTVDLAYSEGFGAFWYFGAPVLLSSFLLYLFSKKIRSLEGYTQGELFSKRYDNKSAFLLSILILIFMIFSAASQVIGLGLFLGEYLNISYELAALIGTTIVIIYSTACGFRGVVITDIIQFFLLLLSTVLILFFSYKYGVIETGTSFINILNTDNQAQSIKDGFLKYFPFVFTFAFSWVIQANVWQRISATKDENDARKMTLMSFFIYIPLYLMVVLTGIFSTKIFSSLPQNGIVSAISLNYMPEIFSVIVFVGILAAIMSTMDSLINTGAMTVVMDILPKKLEESKKLLYSKISTIGIGALALIVGLGFKSILKVCYFASDILTTGALVPLCFALFSKFGSKNGALGSMYFALLFSLYNLLIDFGIRLPAFYKPQSATQVVFGILTSLIIYITLSKLEKVKQVE